jgi:hypothetical protein
LALEQYLENLAWAWTFAANIAQVNNMLYASSVNVSQNRLERRQVRVGIRDDGNSLIWWNLEHSWHFSAS